MHILIQMIRRNEKQRLSVELDRVSHARTVIKL